jgi:hypothetical protein
MLANTKADNLIRFRRLRNTSTRNRMMSPTKHVEKHIHKVKRQKFKSGNEMYFCTLPDCYFKVNPALYLGKESICWRCGNTFIMNEYSLRLAKPHCEKCHQPKDKNSLNPSTDIAQTMDRLQATGTEAVSLSDRLNNVLKNATGDKTVATLEDEDI